MQNIRVKKILVLMLTLTMVLTQMLPSFVVAEGDGTEITQEAEAIVEETTDVEEPAEVDKTIEEVVLEDQVQEDKALETEEAEENAPPVEELTIDEKLVAKLDFSNGRLIVKADEEVFTEGDPVVASLDGVYILQYEDEEHAKDAYTRFSELKDVQVEVDTAFSISDDTVLVNGEETEVTPIDEESMMTEEENPFKEAEEVKTDKIKYDVAVIDTGANNADKTVSVLGDDGKDNHGHGQRMIDIIKDIAPEAKVLSIKAMGDNGTGDVSAVYAAIKLAIEEDVKIINLSISAPKTDDTFIIEEVINEAVEKGIVVVGAAGNNKKDAKDYIPGAIEKAIVVGACDSTGKVISNSGDTVDYYMPAKSSSEATAKVVGYTINGEDIAKVIEGILNLEEEITDEQPVEEPAEEENTEENTEEENASSSETIVDSIVLQVVCNVGANAYQEIPVEIIDSKMYISLEGLPMGEFLLGTEIPANETDWDFEVINPVGFEYDEVNNKIITDTSVRLMQIHIETETASLSDMLGTARDEFFKASDTDLGYSSVNVYGSGVKRTGYSYSWGAMAAYYDANGTRIYCANPYKLESWKYGVYRHSISNYTNTLGKAKTLKIALALKYIDEHVSNFGRREALKEAYIWSRVYGSTAGAGVSIGDMFTKAETWASNNADDYTAEAWWYSGATSGQPFITFTLDTIEKQPEGLRFAKIDYPTGKLITNIEPDAWAIFEVVHKNDETGNTRTYYFKTRDASNATTETPAGYVNFFDKACLITSRSDSLYSKPSNVVSNLDIYYPPGTFTIREVECHEAWTIQRPEVDSYHNITAVINDNLTISNIKAYHNGFYSSMGATTVKMNGITTVYKQGKYSNFPKGTEDNIILIKLGDDRKTQRPISDGHFIWEQAVWIEGNTSDEPDRVFYFTQVEDWLDSDSDWLRIYGPEALTDGSVNWTDYSLVDFSLASCIVDAYADWIPQEDRNKNTYLSDDYFKIDAGHISLPAGSRFRVREVYSSNPDIVVNDAELWGTVASNAAYDVPGAENNDYHVVWDQDTLNQEDVIYFGNGVVGNGNNVVANWNGYINRSLGNVNVFKTAISSWTTDLDTYSLKGATFGIYQTLSDARNDTNRLDTLTTDENGETRESKDLKAGTYYVRELTPPTKGFKLAKDPYIEEVTVTAGNTQSVLFKDPPLHDGPNFSVELKKEQENADIPVPKNLIAVYKVEYFDNYTYSGDVSATWYVKAKADDWGENFGFDLHDMDTTYRYSDSTHTNSPYYKDDNGKLVLPLGSYKITEEIVPDGYALFSKPLKGKVTQIGATSNPRGDWSWDESVTGGVIYINDTATVSEPLKYGRVYIEKVDKNRNEIDGSTEAAGDADLTGIKFNIIYAPSESQKETSLKDGTVLKSGDIVTTITTKKKVVNGEDVYYAETPNKFLPYDRYYIQEVETNGSYLLTDGSKKYFNFLDTNIIPRDAQNVPTIDNYLFEFKAENNDAFENDPKTGKARVYKVLEETDRPTHADATVRGIQYAVINRSIAPMVINRNTANKKLILVGQITDIITVGDDGYTNLSTNLDYGTYEVYELHKDHSWKVGDNFDASSSKMGTSIYANDRGVLWKANHGVQSIKTDGQIIDFNFKNPTAYGGLDVQKINKELQAAQDEGYTSLAGNTFNIVNASHDVAVVEGTTYGKVADKNANKTSYLTNSVTKVTNPTRAALIDAKNEVTDSGAVVKTLTTDETGFAETDLRTLPYGTYYVYEAETNESMLVDQTYVLRFEVREDGIKISTKPIMDENYKVTPNNGLLAENEPIRGDLYFTKVNEDGVLRPNTPFLIVSYSPDGKIVEAHTIVTDSNGIASTAFIYDTVKEDNMIEVTQRERKHSENTNKFDNYVKKTQNEDGTYSYKVTEEGEALLASGEASTYGVWFTQGLHPETGEVIDRSKAPVDNNKGALYYGRYQIFEIQCKENSELGEDLLISDVFAINKKDQTYNANGDLISESSRNVKDKQRMYQNAFVDLEVLIASKAKDVITDTQVTFANAEVVLSDTISFSNIKATSEYRWEVEFTDTETGRVLSTVTVDRFRPETTNNAVNTTNQPNFSFVVKTDGTIEPYTDDNGDTHPAYQGTPIVTSTGNVDTTGLDGKDISVVVYLYEYITGYDHDSSELYKDFEALNFIKSHNTEMNDEEQKIYVPAMESDARDIFTGDHVGTKYNIGENYDEISNKDAIIDNIILKNIAPKEKYMLVEYLWDKTENKKFSEEQISYSWYSDRLKNNHIDEWTHEMDPFYVDSKDFGEKTIVVMAELWRVDDAGNKIDDIPVVTHEDEADERESVHWIDINTTLTDEFTADHVGTVKEKVTLTDKVELKNLVKDMEYVIKGELVYQKDCTTVDGINHKAGELVPILGESVTEVTFVAPDYGDFEVEVTYVIDSKNLEGISVVSTEYAYHNDVLIDKHVDLEDEHQTVRFPKIRTKAADGKTSDDVGTVMEDGTLIDTVQLWNLIEGEEYTVSGTLVYQENGTPVEGVSTTPVTFVATADQTEYTEVEIKFTGIDATKLAGRSVVVFEKLYHPNENTGEPVEVNRHEDLTDKDQTVHYPSVRTKAVDKRTGDKVGSIFGEFINGIRKFFGGEVEDDAQTEIVDTVILGNLVPGRTYTINGVLMDQDTKELLTGKEITATATITVGEGTITGSNGEKTTVTNWDEEHNSVSGTVDLTFRLGTEEVTNKTVVVFEKLIHNDIEVNRHEDFDDRAQFVNLIEVDSEAIDANTGNHVGDVPGSTLETAKIIETFNMRKLVNGEDYKIDFALLVKEDSEIQGKPVYLAKDGTFTENREEAINEIIDMTALAEKEASGWRIEVSKEEEVIETFEGATYDEVEALYEAWFEGLTDEEKADTTTKVVINAFNEMVPDEDAFSAGAQMVVEFEIDKDTVEGKTIVVVADVYHNDVMVATHSDMYNEDESVHFPKIETEATDEQTKEHVGVMGEKTVIIDKVEYTNLLPDHEYEITGFLMDKETGEKYLDADGNEVFGTTGTFTVAEGEENGYKEVRFEFNGSNLEGKTIVVFEDLYHNGINIERHYDIEDEAQTIHYPSIRTRAINKKTGTQVLKSDEEAVITDIIHYENLVPNLTYKFTATIYDVETGEMIDDLVATTEITPTEFDGSGEVVLEFDASKLAGKAYVFKEVLSINVPDTGDVVIFTHFDINNLDETFYIPEIGTVAIGETTNENFIVTEENQVIIDTISYKGMKPGSENIAVLTVYDKTLGEILTDIAPVEQPFTANEDGIGTVEVKVTVDGTKYKGHDLVMFEEVYTKPDETENPDSPWRENPTAEHKDAEDEAQTIHVPEIGTKAELADTEEDITTNMTRIKDTVSYTNLIPGKEYTLEARGMNPETGKAAVKEDGTEYVFTKTFTPETADGEVVVEMLFKQSDIVGTSMVAFEKLFVEYGTENQLEVTNHEDITDENQTVELYQSVKITVTKKSAGTMYPLKGAEITVFDSKDNVINDRFGKPAVGITDENGVVVFEIFAYKNESYYVKETKAPAGYHINTNKFELVRDENGNLKAEIDLEIIDNLLIIPPTPVKTGDETNIALWALLLTLSLLGVAVAQKKRLLA